MSKLSIFRLNFSLDMSKIIILATNSQKLPSLTFNFGDLKLSVLDKL